MKSILSVEITDEGKYWRKEIRVFGVPVYQRHDYTESEGRRAVGFGSMAYVSGEIEDLEE